MGGQKMVEKGYTDLYRRCSLGSVFPNEYVIRIFKGSYPNLRMSQTDFKDRKICDIGCGDGRNLVLLDRLEFKTYGTEITQDICDRVARELNKIGIDSCIRVGKNEKIPFDSQFFDYLLSWNSCYYMGQKGNYGDFDTHVRELHRVLRGQGKLVLSIPKPSNFIFNDSVEVKPGYALIRNDPYEIRNNEVLKCFKDESEIRSAFSPYFKEFIFGSIHDDCFGQDNHWFLVVCQRNAI
jgi:SAM-dependent methyltransferase